jgi:hypothetical protein
MFAENIEYEILTPSGWQDFKGITRTTDKITYKLTLSNNEIVEATSGHYFFQQNVKIQLKDLKVGEYIDTVNGSIQIISIEKLKPTTVYDMIEVSDKLHRFIVNNCFITKNCDEFAYVEPNIAVEFWTSISPTLATGGKAIITSTPNSDEDQFAQIWNEANKLFDEYGNQTEVGRNGFAPFKAIWSEHPDRDEAWAQAERSRVGVERFEREHCCKFLVFDETLINSISLSNLDGIEPIMKMGQARWYKSINPACTYIFSLDPSLGTGGDYAAIEIIELPTLIQVGEWRHNTTPVQSQARILRELVKYVDGKCKDIGVTSSIYYSVENNTLGESAIVAINELGEESFPGLFLSEPIKKGHARRFRKGFNTTHPAKIATCAKLKQLVESRQITINSKPLVSELKSFVANGITFEAKTGQYDDLVSSLLLAVRMIMLLQEWDPMIYEKMRDHTGLEEYDLPLPIYVSTF